MAFPRFRIKIGPIPLYIIDMFLVLTAFQARRIRLTRRSSLRPLVIFILGLAFLSEVVAGLRMGTLQKPIYIIARTFLAASLFFSVPKIIHSKQDLEKIINAVLPGTLLTALLLIMTSLPQTRGFVVGNIFSLPFLEPAAESVLGKYQLTMEAMRGRSLIGVSILSGAFLNSTWPLFFLLRTEQKLGPKWRFALLATMILTPIAVVMTYSRGAILGLLLVVLTTLFFNSGKVRQSVILGIGIASIIFFWVGWESDYFFFDRLTRSTQVAFESNFQDKASIQRIQGYSQPFKHVLENPFFLFVGEGFAQRKVETDQLLAWGTGAIHSVFSAAYYGYGLMAAFAYMLLFFKAFRNTWKHASASGGGFATLFSQTLLASLAGFSSWFLLGHAAVSQPRGAMLLFLVFGLVAAQSNFSPSSEPVQTERAQVAPRHSTRSLRS
jgi:hypothetical protein